jgi:DNA-binding CsgD family transcriptional regulator
VERLRAEIVFARRRGSDAPALLLHAARRLEPLDAAIARETHLEAIAAAIYAGRLVDAPDVHEVAETAAAAPAAPQPPRALDLLLDGLAIRFVDGYPAGVPPLRKALDAFRGVEVLTESDARWLWLACRVARNLWDDEVWYELVTRGLHAARETGALRMLPIADEAFSAAQRGCEQDDAGLFAWSLVEMIEAGVRTGAADGTSAALDRLSERTRASGTDWALGIEAGSRALLSEGDGAETLYREALARLARSRGVVHLARARLLYGEWLRRESRRVDAREQLRAAHEMFSGIGAEGFAERARHELMATGETARRRTDDTRGVLTPQEAHIARLARDGLSNPEIGAQLFISPRTVQYHLRKVFQKLDIASRSQLSRLPASHLNTA